MRAIAAVAVLSISLLTACHAVSPPSWQERQAVAARARALLSRDDQSPGREFINRLRSEDYPARLRWMADADHVWSHADLDAYRDYIKIVEHAERGSTWPTPPAVKVPRSASAITIDGSLADEPWSRAFVWHTSYRFNQQTPAAHTTVWKMLWDENYLYVAFVCSDDQIQSRPRAQDGPVYDDDCVELFISPDIRFRSYWEIVVNPDGSVFDSIECKRIDQWGSDLNPAADIDGLVARTQRVGPPGLAGYTTEMAVPWSAILLPGRSAQAGDRFAFMLARLDWKQDTLSPMAPIPLLGWAHNIWNMATMELDK